MKYIFIFLLPCLLFVSCLDDTCETTDEVVDCTDAEPPYGCETNSIDTGDLVIRVTIDDKHTQVPLYFFRGNVSEDNLFYTNVATESETIYVLSHDTYTVAAKYFRAGDAIIVIDSGDLEEDSEEECNEEGCAFTCYESGRRTLRLYLKD